AAQACSVYAELQAARVAQVPAGLAEQAEASRVHQVALHRVDRDRLAVAVVVQAFLRVGGAADEIERAPARAEQPGTAVAGAVVAARQRRARAEIGRAHV